MANVVMNAGIKKTLWFVNVVPQGHCAIVTRFGKPVRIATSGLNFFIPFLDSCKNVAEAWGNETNKKGYFIELTEQILNTAERPCFTKDNVKLTVDCAIRWRVVDPIKAVYDIDQLHVSLVEAVLAEVRSFIGAHELNYVLTSRQQITEHVIAGVSDTIKRWGVNLLGAEVQKLEADPETVAAMRQQLEASRKSEAMKLEADGKAEAMVKEAKAQKEAAILRAQGEAEAQRLLAEGDWTYLQTLSESVGKEMAGRILLAQKTLATYGKLTSDPANKVFLPIEALPSAVIADAK